MSKMKDFIKSQKGKRILSISALVLWMGIIFLFSHQTSEKSGNLSRPIQNTVFESTIGKNEYETVRERNLARVKLGEMIRSGAHFLLFTVLGVLSLTAFMTFKMKMWQNVLLATVLGWIYGVLDEIHQVYVPGRSFQLNDLGADFAGVTLGVAATLGIVLIVRFIRKKKNVENS